MVKKPLSPSGRQLVRLACVCIIGAAGFTAAKADNRAACIGCAPSAFRLSTDNAVDAPALRACMIADKVKLGTSCWAVF